MECCRDEAEALADDCSRSRKHQGGTGRNTVFASSAFVLCARGNDLPSSSGLLKPQKEKAHRQIRFHR